MNINDIRVTLADILRDAVTDGWEVTTTTLPDVHQRVIEVGHADQIRYLTYTSYEATLRIVVWVSEVDDVDAISDLYELVTPGSPTCIQTILMASELVAGPIEAGNVGPRENGPSGFVACDVLIPVQATRET